MIMPAKLQGSIVALVTPMTPNNAIDFEKLESILKWHVAEGTNGVVILGTTGEASTINMDERTEIIKRSVKTVNGAIPVIVGTGTIDTQKVIELSKHAMSLGADATLVITPYYVKPPQRALVTHFRTIADAVPLPMLLYNCPGRTGVDMKPETIAELASHPMIIGVKDATGDLTRISPLRSLCGGDFLIYSGEDDSGCEFVRLGGDGVISVTANVAPKAVRTMLAASKQGKKADAEAINDYLMPLHKRLFLESNPIPVKRALQLMGKIDTGIRSPLVKMDDVHVDALREALILGKVL
jgi:4-hydroxy-tetrahydrodipicolinate synthase